jgi:hypothetical protein
MTERMATRTYYSRVPRTQCLMLVLQVLDEAEV